MSSLLRVFPADPIPFEVKSASAMTLCLQDGRRILDLTGGATSHMILGWNHPQVNDAISVQLQKFSHIDYKAWTDPNCEKLADKLVSEAKHGLDKVYFAGNSGGEACEAAIKMSYQWHYDTEKPNKQWVISRKQSYHGSSSDAMCLGDRPNLEMYRPILPVKRSQIEEHNPIRHKLPDESLEQYAIRSADALEKEIIRLGPENVAAFVGETMMGGLVGDVPPSPGYWQRIREICTQYDVHLILDEVYCGTGTSGKVFCIDWDGVTPDFLFMGKTLAAGYAPINAVMTKSEFEDVIVKGQKRLQHSTTHQAYSLGVAAAIEVQNIIASPGFLENVNSVATFMRSYLDYELSGHPYFVEIRGRGLRFSFEYNCHDLPQFSDKLGRLMLEKHNIYVSAKWHRLCFTPSLILTKETAEYALDRLVKEFKSLANNW